MAVKAPKNKIVIKYTSGGEYLVEKTYQSYQGYYYEFNNKIYAGKEFNSNSPILIKKGSEKVNTLLTNPSTITYGAISGIKLLSSKISSIPFNLNDLNLNNLKANLLFLCSKVNENPPRIKQIDEETYTSLQENPLFKTTFVGTYQNKTKSIEEANRDIPGVQALLTPVQTPVTPFKSTPTNNSIQPVFFQTASLSTFIPNPISTQPRVQDIIPIGPIVLSPTPLIIPTPTAPILSSLSLIDRTNTTVTIGATLVSTTNSIIVRKGTSYNTSPGFLYTNALDTGDADLGAFTQTRTGLSPETNYYYFAYAMNIDNYTGSVGENTFWTLSNPPTVQATDLVAVTGSSTEIRLSWTPATFPGSGATYKRYLLLRSIYPNEPNITNNNGEEITPDGNTTIQSYSILSTAVNYTASGLTTDTTYNFKLIPFTTYDISIPSGFITANYLTELAPTASASLVFIPPPPPPCTADGYNIGDLYETTISGVNVRGYVYYKDTCNIYIVGLEDLYATDLNTERPSKAEWGCLGIQVFTDGTGGNLNIGYGLSNTSKIIEANCDPTLISPFAANLCYEYGGKPVGWALPTTGDWNKINDNINILPGNAGLKDDYYWASNEEGDKFPETLAFAYNPILHIKLPFRKDNTYLTRPVMKISNP